MPLQPGLFAPQDLKANPVPTGFSDLELRPAHLTLLQPPRQGACWRNPEVRRGNSGIPEPSGSPEKRELTLQAQQTKVL